MPLNITIIDHHIIPISEFIHKPDLKIVMGFDQDNYYENVKPYINQSFDFIISDENPDAMLAASIYLLGQDEPPRHKCLARELRLPDFEKLAAAGKKNIAIFNSLRIYYSDFDDVDSITLINPHESGLQNISVSQILYKAIAAPTEFMRDLAGIAIVLDYTLDAAFETIVEIVSAYPDIFADLLEHIKNITLNKYNVHDSAFGGLTAMFRAPSILHGLKGVETVVNQLLNNPPFQITDLLNGSSNKAIEYLQKCMAQYKKILADEHELFEKEKQINGQVIIYSPHFQSENFVREFSNTIKDNNVDSIIVMKTPTRDNLVKYSIRRGELEIDLGKLLEEMGVGGGNPFAAGCTVRDSESFEKSFLRKIGEFGF